MTQSINHERHCLKWLNRLGCVVCFIAVGVATSLGAEKKAEIPQALERAVSKAISEDYSLFAPSHFGEIKRLYGEVEAASRNGESAQQIGARSEQAMRALKETGSVAATVRAKLGNVLAIREAALKLESTMAQRLARADQFLQDAGAKAEAGNWEEASRAEQAAALEYWHEGGKFLAERKLPRIRQELDVLRGKAPSLQLEAVENEYQAIATALQEPSPGKLNDLNRRIADIFKRIYPPFYLDPPMVLQMGDFTLYVESYEGRSWDFTNQTINGASGIAWVSFDCHPKKVIWYPGLLTTAQALAVVEIVKDPTKQISVADAKKIDPTRAIGSALEVQIPIYAKTGLQIAESIQNLIQWAQQPRGDIKVRFENLTIVPGATPGTGLVVSGSATYPTAPPVPETVTLPVAGFTLYIHKLTFTPSSATANGELEMPASIVDPGSGHPGRVSLGDFTITNDCKFRRELPSTAFGPWSVGNTEMLVRGTGVVTDFDDAWAAPGLPAGSAAANPGWRGVVLDHGDTVPTSDRIISNSGYLRATFSFNKAEITAPGLKGSFKLSAPFEFMSLEPVGYVVRVAQGQVDLADSAVFFGEFKNGILIAPRPAVEKAGGGTLGANYSAVNLDANLDLKGSAQVASGIRWGEFTQHRPGPTFYETGKPRLASFYLSGTYKKNYFPLGSSGFFLDPNALLTDPAITEIQGLSIFFPESFTIFTPDTPGQKPLLFQPHSEDRLHPDWLNISFGGVHGRVSNMCTGRDTKTDLGPIEKPFYEGNNPKVPFKASGGSSNEQTGCRGYNITSTFVSSAVYDCGMSGTLHIPTPIDSDLAFANMAFTSTAQNAGGKVPFTNPLKLSYWGLDMVPKPGASSAGVISVRTGQVFFTAAGIRESRHFAEPFYLTWGEMLASGALRRLGFDYDSAGQKFDRFHYTPSFVRLSDYDTANPTKPPYLKVAGSAHIDFFGAKYINLHDTYDSTKGSVPFNNRVISLMGDSSPGLFGPTDSKLMGNWSDDFGRLDFTYQYDDGAQDGFIGTGQMSFLWVSGMMSSSIVVKAERICASVNDTNRHDFKLGPVAHFGVMSRITGCGCIENSQLERVMLSAELETTADANVFIRNAGYGSIEWTLTPSISQLEIQGDMYLSLLRNGNIETQGHAKFTVDRAHDFVEGEVDGKFNGDSALGFNSISADGQLNWHLGKFGGDSYQSIQGKVAVSVVMPFAGSGGEGGFYVGINAPKSEAWVLASGGDKFKLNMTPLPDRLTGVYGYAKLSSSINAYVFSGGIETYAGLGGFVAPIGGAPTGVGLPFVVGNLGVHIWGEILGGAVSAGGWADLNIMEPYPFSFQGTLGLEGCVAWVFCDSVDVSVGLNTSEGLFVK
jgi:hypothetical protein